jgi:hypothetical protein
MYRYSKTSQAKLATVHPDLQRLFNEAIKHLDIKILEGARSFQTQRAYFESGASSTMNSKHLIQSDGYSHAVDSAPWPINWNTKDTRVAGEWYLYAGFLKGLAQGMGIEIRIGADWDGDFDIHDQKFDDLVHIELK